MMSDSVELRREIVRLNNAQDRTILLCLEPLGEQLEMQPGQTYAIVTVGGTEGSLEVILEEGKIIVYGWNNSDSAVFHEGQRVAGMQTGT
jgi:hypothetical protein